MPSFRSSKLAQLGGIGCLGAYLVLQAWWLTSVAPDDTADETLIVLLLGAPIAFIAGWIFVPVLAKRFRPDAHQRKKRSRGHHRV